MNSYGGYERIQPSHLVKDCLRCEREMPYDPTTSICAGCDRSLTRYNSGSGSEVPGISQAMPNNLPLSSLKRRAETRDESENPTKRVLTNTHDGSLIRRTVVGPAAGTTYIKDEFQDDDQEDFVDAKEVQGSDGGASEHEEQIDSSITEQDGETDASEEDAEVEEEADADVEMNDPEEPDSDADDDDLFKGTFGDDAEEIKSEDGEEDGAVHTSTQPKKISQAKQATDYNFDAAEHTDGCAHIRRPSTPPDDSRTKTPSPPGAPDPKMDISRNLKRQKIFHARAVDLIPRLPLASHRYWIGVLHLGMNSKNITQEKQFSWMKGNRFTTVETVWNMYQQNTATYGFVLMLGSERVDFKDRMEELDYFNTKKIILMAVPEGSEEAVGRSIIQGVVPLERKPKVKQVVDVIELD